VLAGKVIIPLTESIRWHGTAWRGDAHRGGIAPCRVGWARNFRYYREKRLCSIHQSITRQNGFA
ncbi:MAG: hypothetical protein WCE65_01055, partial [Methanoregula sp.]